MMYSALASKCHSWRKYLVIVGGIFIYLPIGVPWYFGNLATYITSYYHAREPNGRHIVSPQWIFAAFFVAFSLAITASGYLSNSYGPRLTVILALATHSGATFLSYFAIQHSMLALILTFGAMGGIGAGLAYGPPLPIVIKWMPQRIGLASGALMTGFGGGAVFYNELITFFINPHNLRPDVRGTRTTYFSQPDILTRIPQLFLLLGALTVVLQSIGVFLLREPRDGDYIDAVELNEVKPIVSKEPQTAKTSTPSQMSATQEPSTPPTTSLSLSQEEKSAVAATTEELAQHECPATLELTVNGAPPPALHSPSSQAQHGPLSDLTPDKEELQPPQDSVQPKVEDKSPRQILKTSNFYILWVALAVNHYGYIIKNNYYKEYGQLRIHNDHFLTFTGTIATIAVVVARVLWGLATDWLGMKLTMLVFLATTAVTTSFWHLSLYGGPAVYMTWVVLISAVFTGAFIIFPLASLRCFGEKHYASNYGIILTSQIVLNLISPPIIKVILHYLGWFWLFFSISIVNFLGIFAVLFLDIERK